MHVRCQITTERGMLTSQYSCTWQRPRPGKGKQTAEGRGFTAQRGSNPGDGPPKESAAAVGCQDILQGAATVSQAWLEEGDNIILMFLQHMGF